MSSKARYELRSPLRVTGYELQAKEFLDGSSSWFATRNMKQVFVCNLQQGSSYVQR